MERLSLLYASALYDLSVKNNAIQEFLGQAVFMSEALADEKCLKVLVHPHIRASDKRAFFKQVFAGQIHDDMLNFLYLTVDKNREAFIVPALRTLIELIERYNNKVTAKVMTATPLDEDQKAEMKTTLASMLSKTVELSMKVDPSIIGGPFIFVDGYYIDWTIKRRMRDLTVKMKEGCSA